MLIREEILLTWVEEVIAALFGARRSLFAIAVHRR
jgi:hypothetical protein